eukprot:1568156-Rhodomonas_salina.1
MLRLVTACPGPQAEPEAQRHATTGIPSPTRRSAAPQALRSRASGSPLLSNLNATPGPLPA